MRLAIIPARGGSKRIPRKNIRPFAGRPMIAWSIDAARAAGCFDRIIVSTDDPHIAEVAADCGAELPFVRPAEFADDHVDTITVIAHAIGALGLTHSPDVAVCCIYATAPFLRAEDLRAGADLLAREACDYVFPVSPYAFPIQRALRLSDGGRVTMFQPECYATRSQDLEAAFHDAGQFYWGRAQAWLAGTPVFGASSAALVLPRHRVQDIDTEDDWLRAELMFEALLRQEGGR